MLSQRKSQKKKGSYYILIFEQKRQAVGTNAPQPKKQPPKKTNPDGEPECSLSDVNGVPMEDPRLRNIEPRLLERIINEILEKAPSVTWDDIGLWFLLLPIITK